MLVTLQLELELDLFIYLELDASRNLLRANRNKGNKVRDKRTISLRLNSIPLCTMTNENLFEQAHMRRRSLYSSNLSCWLKLSNKRRDIESGIKTETQTVPLFPLPMICRLFTEHTKRCYYKSKVIYCFPLIFVNFKLDNWQAFFRS